MLKCQSFVFSFRKNDIYKKGCNIAFVHSFRWVIFHHQMCEQHCTDKAASSPEQSVMSREGVPGRGFMGNSSVRHHFIRTLGKQPYSLISLCPTLFLHPAKFRDLGTLFPFNFVPCVVSPFLYSLYITSKCVRVCVCVSVYKRPGYF